MTKKARFIEQLTALSKEEKAMAAAFFTQYPQYENLVDWNNESIAWRDFEIIFALQDSSHGAVKRRAKRDPGLLFEGHNCQIIGRTEDFLIVNPLDWECAVFFNSYECGGIGAKWCIGDKKSPKIWKSYKRNGNFFYFVFFIKKNIFLGKKIMISYNVNTDEIELWLQNDRSVDFEIFAYFLRQHYQICAENPDDKQLFLDFGNVLIDNNKYIDNIFLLQLVKKAYEFKNKPDEWEDYF